MFREIAYIVCILGVSTFGTEILFRFKPSNDIDDSDYILQSNLVMVSSAIGIISALFVLKNIDKISRIRMQGLTVLILCLFIVTITLRSKYHFTIPTVDSKFSLYNSTSVFLCVTMAAWSPFWFFKKPEPLSQPMPLSERPSNVAENDVHAVHRYDTEEIDYTLPTYSEVPSPPAYTKTILPPPDNAMTVDDTYRPAFQLTNIAPAEASSTYHLNNGSNNEVGQSNDQRQQYHSESSEASSTRRNNPTNGVSTVSTNANDVSSLADDGDENGNLAGRTNNNEYTATAPAESSSTDVRKDC